MFEAQFVQGVACFPDDRNTIFIQARHASVANWVISGGLTLKNVSIALPIICLCYIKKNTATGSARYQKRMVKFSLYLELGGSINIAGQPVPGATAYYTEPPGLHLAYGIAAASFLLTAMIIIAYLNSVQDKKTGTCG